LAANIHFLPLHIRYMVIIYPTISLIRINKQGGL
jgi:hypothetical protein